MTKIEVVHYRKTECQCGINTYQNTSDTHNVTTAQHDNATIKRLDALELKGSHRLTTHPNSEVIVPRTACKI
jgi:hypothetical protein